MQDRELSTVATAELGDCDYKIFIFRYEQLANIFELLFNYF